MKSLCLIDQRELDLLKAELGVRTRLSRKAEGAVTLAVKGHEGERGEDILVLYEPAHINAAALQGAEQHDAEGIHADFADDSRAVSQISKRREEICRCAARVRCHGRIAFHIFGFLRKINQHFPECHNFCHVKPPVFSLPFAVFA